MAQKLGGQAPSSARWAGQLGSQALVGRLAGSGLRRANISFEFKGRNKVNVLVLKTVRQAKIIFSCLGEGPPFCSIQAFNWLDKQFALPRVYQSKANLIPEHCNTNTQKDVWWTIWVPSDPIKLKYKMNSHRGWCEIRPQGSSSVSCLSETFWEHNQWQDKLGRSLSIWRYKWVRNRSTHPYASVPTTNIKTLLSWETHFCMEVFRLLDYVFLWSQDSRRR